MNRIAICSCGEPLISTFAFSGSEYFCVGCGRVYGMMDADRAMETPELKKRLSQLERKWTGIRKGLLSGGAMLRDCDSCSQENEPHLRHASPQEIEAHKKAMEKIGRIRG